MTARSLRNFQSRVSPFPYKNIKTDRLLEFLKKIRAISERSSAAYKELCKTWKSPEGDDCPFSEVDVKATILRCSLVVELREMDGDL